MSETERLDLLLAEAIESGEVPSDATSAERLEIERLLAARGRILSSSAVYRAEARASQPNARARFERFVTTSRAVTMAPVAAAPRSPSRPWWRGDAHLPRGALLSGAAAAVLVVAVAVLGIAVLSSGVESAAAQVLNPGAYVQVEGVVERAGDGSSLIITSELGRVRVGLSGDTVILDERPGSPGIGPGARVLLSGVVGDGRVVAATTLAVREADASPNGPGRFRRLDRSRPELSGRVLALSLAPDGSSAVVTVETPGGERFIVPVAPVAAEQLLRVGTVVGTDVRIVPGAQDGPFDIEPGADGDGPAGRPHGPIPATRGVVTGRAGDILTVRTPAGTVDVLILPRTRIFTAGTGIDPGAVARGEADITGYSVAVAGGQRAPGGAIVASHLVVGRDLR